MGHLYDAHCHLGFADDAVAIAQQARSYGIHALCSTVSPEGFDRTRMLLAGLPNIAVGLGLHPWWIDEGRVGTSDLTIFEGLAPEAPFIGEVGLDFSRYRKRTRQAQTEAFARTMGCIKEHCPGKPVFLHAVRSTEAVLGILEQLDLFASNDCVFHWFTGSAQQLHRAAAQGAWFSCSARMAKGQQGAQLVAMVPAERLLVETDAPAHEGDAWSAAEWASGIESAIEAIAAARDCGADEARALIAGNYERLCARMGMQALVRGRR